MQSENRHRGPNLSIFRPIAQRGDRSVFCWHAMTVFGMQECHAPRGVVRVSRVIVYGKQLLGILGRSWAR